jgi:GT2 family glycosyltransferase
LESIKKTPKFGFNAEVLIIDNSPEEKCNQLIDIHETAQIWCVEPHENLGYFGGARYGLEYYCKNHELPNWIIVSNADMEMNDPDFFRILGEVILPADTAVVAPSIRSGTYGKDLNPHLRKSPSGLRIFVWKRIFTRRLLFHAWLLGSQVKKSFTQFRRVIGNVDQELPRRRIYSPHGSFIIFTKRFFEAGGHLNYRCFLYYEELFVAEEVARLGMTIAYVPALKVVHEEKIGIAKSISRENYRHIAAGAQFWSNYYSGIVK